MRKTKSAAQATKDTLSITDAIFLTKARQKIAAGVTGFLGVSLIGVPIIIASIKPEDILANDEFFQ